MKRLKDLLAKEGLSTTVEALRGEPHHHPFDAYSHTIWCSFIVLCLARREIRHIAVAAAALHDVVCKFPVLGPSKYLNMARIFKLDAHASSQYARAKNRHPVACRAIERHMSKYVPWYWLDEITFLVMTADILVSFTENVMTPIVLIRRLFQQL